MGKKPKKLARAALSYLFMWIALYAMGIMVSISYFTNSPTALSEVPPLLGIISIITSFCGAFRTRQVLSDSYDAFVDITITLAWFAVVLSDSYDA